MTDQLNYRLLALRDVGALMAPKWHADLSDLVWHKLAVRSVGIQLPPGWAVYRLSERGKRFVEANFA